MAVLNYTVRFGGANVSSGTVLNDVQHFSINRGRQWLVDNYAPSSATIQSRNISAWTTAPVIGDMVSIFCTSTGGGYIYSGFIKDVAIIYGTIPSMDYAIITCEGPLAKWGRRQFTSKSLTQAKTLTQAVSQLSSPAGLSPYINTYGPGYSTASAQTYSGNGLDALNTLVQTEIGHIAETSGTLPTVFLSPRNWDVAALTTWTDSTTAGVCKYDNIGFASAAQNYYTQVTIEPLALTTQVAGTGAYGLVQSSYDYTESQALSHAQYLLSQFNTTVSTPITLTASYANQDTVARQQAFAAALQDTYTPSGYLTQITFRGTVYKSVIEGVNITVDQSETNVEMTLSAFDNNNYLILNNAVFGTLGTSVTYPGNKLGF